MKTYTYTLINEGNVKLVNNTYYSLNTLTITNNKTNVTKTADDFTYFEGNVTQSLLHEIFNEMQCKIKLYILGQLCQLARPFARNLPNRRLVSLF